MPTILSHPAPVLALSMAMGTRLLSPRLTFTALVASILPDFDVAGFHLGVHYAEVLGHRGLTHSLFFALALALLAFACGPLLRSRRRVAFAVIFFATLSHTLLDAMTNGGLGVAFFAPFDETRYFLPWRPISVSPLGLKAFLSDRGLRVILSELRWIWLPCMLFGLVSYVLRKVSGRRKAAPAFQPRYPKLPGDPERPKRQP